MIRIKFPFVVTFLLSVVTLSQPQNPKLEAVAVPPWSKAFAIVSGSACPQKHSKKTQLLIMSDELLVPLSFDLTLMGNGQIRKTCQARITLNPGDGFQFVIREVSQNVMASIQPKTTVQAEIGFGLVGGKDYQIDQKIGPVSDAGEHRHILVKKIVNYLTPCGREAVFRAQTNVVYTGKGTNTFESETLKIALERQSCTQAE